MQLHLPESRCSIDRKTNANTQKKKTKTRRNSSPRALEFSRRIKHKRQTTRNTTKHALLASSSRLYERHIRRVFLPGSGTWRPPQSQVSLTVKNAKHICKSKTFAGQHTLPSTYRNETACGVRGSNGQRRAAEERLVRVDGHEVGQHHDEREDQLDGQSFPGAQRRTVRDGCLQIALVAGHRDAAKQ